MSSATPRSYEKTYHMAIFRNWYFQTVLAASGGLDVALGGYHYSKPLEDGRNGFSNWKKRMWHLTCVYVQKMILRLFLGRIWPLAASDLKNVALRFLNMKVPPNFWLLAKECGRYLKKWEKELPSLFFWDIIFWDHISLLIIHNWGTPPPPIKCIIWSVPFISFLSLFPTDIVTLCWMRKRGLLEFIGSVENCMHFISVSRTSQPTTDRHVGS